MTCVVESLNLNVGEGARNTGVGRSRLPFVDVVQDCTGLDTEANIPGKVKE